MGKLVLGKVVHYYDKIEVAVVRLENSLKTGDSVKFAKDDNEFEQKIESMQYDHKSIEEGKKGQEVAIKVDKPVKKGTDVYRA